MESMQLEDLPLFNGDLLSVGLTASLTDADPGLSSFVDDGLLGLQQDGFIWSEMALEDSALKPSATTDSLDTELLNSPTTPSQGDLLGSDWLDTRVDLVEYLGASEEPPATSTMLEATPIDAASLLDSLSLAVAQSSPIPSPVASSAAPNQAVDMLEVLAKLTEAMDTDFEFSEQPGVEMPYEPILSPMSAEEVDSILSSSPTSPGNSSTMEDSGFVDDDYNPQYDTVDLSAVKTKKPQRGKARASRNASDPYPKPANSKEAKALERKLRKKQQNKDAALRYRQKKKTEVNVHQTECEKLEDRNKELREKVDSMTREIDYLKTLMAEVYKAKGLIK